MRTNAGEAVSTTSSHSIAAKFLSRISMNVPRTVDLGALPLRGVRARGFSLIELLVVIAIIAVLAALGISFLGRSAESGRRATDLANLRQLATAFQTFAAEKGRFPDGSTVAGQVWDVQILPYLGASNPVANTTVGLTDPGGANVGIFAGSWDKIERPAGTFKRSFAIAEWINNASGASTGLGATWPANRGAPVFAIKRPSSYVLLVPVDRSSANSGNVVGKVGLGMKTWPGDNAAEWPYDGSGPFAFCDGSVRLLRRDEVADRNGFRNLYGNNK
jgi:prepilin-type N-terminal cleavage/methylation domain-containing protein/prepilin-type processing-associated H-X9-DG protein